MKTRILIEFDVEPLFPQSKRDKRALAIKASGEDK